MCLSLVDDLIGVTWRAHGASRVFVSAKITQFNGAILIIRRVEQVQPVVVILELFIGGAHTPCCSRQLAVGCIASSLCSIERSMLSSIRPSMLCKQCSCNASCCWQAGRQAVQAGHAVWTDKQCWRVVQAVLASSFHSATLTVRRAVSI